MTKKEWRPRISIAIPEDMFDALQYHIPWGLKNKLFIAFAQQILDISKTHGPMALGLLAHRGFEVKLREVGDELKRAEGLAQG